MTSHAPSPNLVKYPIMISLWLDVPMTIASLFLARLYSTIILHLAEMLPLSSGVSFPVRRTAASASTAGCMSTTLYSVPHMEHSSAVVL